MHHIKYKKYMSNDEYNTFAQKMYITFGSPMIRKSNKKWTKNWKIAIIERLGSYGKYSYDISSIAFRKEEDIVIFRMVFEH